MSAQEQPYEPLPSYAELRRDARVLVLRWRIASAQLDARPGGEAEAYWRGLEESAWLACMGRETA